MVRRRGLAAALLLLIASRAHAEPAPLPPFAMLDRASGGSRVGTWLGLQLYDDSDSDGGNVDDRLARRLDIEGEYAVTSDDGVTAVLPVIWNPRESGSGQGDHRGLGATQIGGYHRLRLGERAGVFLRAGVILPTDGFVTDAGYEQHVVVHGTIFPRLEDPAVAGDVLWLRAGACYRYLYGPVAAQVDLLTDAPLADVYGSGGGIPARLHAGGGLAYRHPRFRLGGEILISGFQLFDPEDVEPDGIDEDHREFFIRAMSDATFYERTLIAATLSGAVVLGRWEVLGWFSNPLDDYIRSHVHAFGVGVQMGL